MCVCVCVCVYVCVCMFVYVYDYTADEVICNEACIFKVYILGPLKFYIQSLDIEYQQRVLISIFVKVTYQTFVCKKRRSQKRMYDSTRIVESAKSSYKMTGTMIRCMPVKFKTAPLIS